MVYPFDCRARPLFLNGVSEGRDSACPSPSIFFPIASSHRNSMKVRMQTSTSQTTGIMHSVREFGGVSSLFRGMAGPLGTATLVNAIIFSSYGFSSKLYDQYITEPRQERLRAENLYDDDDNEESPTHDPWEKAMVCGSFAGAVNGGTLFLFNFFGRFVSLQVP